ncbi:uncharacterized protein CIMG_03101 [Coccidioides immitis RS]|uniref:Uncharacterized protein n=3 Tax=Coccidioides immitis TaxID=5501 RepID=J3KAL9_COCIM|nr:uncharacterized protein CIMG_03101 [Coccidioides immitis RS]EAS32077.3 hypothetical protein CIMG_03101 [Coccidioides immitis RS]KMP07270.1 hypothetical protein CIRG_06951 [Coccidioides immitis RMSCC 2394]KMU82345.1 hypothetical protein CIHG_00129 [Coccidioides immitis H538.4]TPX19258.1 hypothetical protein DIZ76_017046 [Coccidioides immitis]
MDSNPSFRGLSALLQLRLVRELEQSRLRLTEALERSNAQLCHAEAQGRRDRDLILALQSKVLELESSLQDTTASKKVEKSSSGLKSFVLEPKKWLQRAARFAKSERRVSPKTDVEADSENSHLQRIFEQLPPEIDLSTVVLPAELRARSKQQQTTTGTSIEASSRLSDSNAATNSATSTTFASLFAGPQDNTIRDPIFTAEFFTREFRSLFGSIEDWAKKYSKTRDDWDTDYNAMSDEFRVNLHFAADVSSAILLLLNENRFLAITKVIATFLMRSVLCLDVFRGFDREIDTDISRMSRLLPDELHAQRRDSLYGAIGLQVLRLRNRPPFENFFPQAHEREYQRIAWVDLAKVMEAAHNLSLYMHSGPYEFNIKYSPVNVRFEGGTPRIITLNITPKIGFRNVNIQFPSQLRRVADGEFVVEKDLAPLPALARKLQETGRVSYRRRTLENAPWRGRAASITTKANYA